MTQHIYSCGICDHYHRADWDGDCREDAERMTIDDVIERFGEEDTGWEEVPMPGTDEPDLGDLPRKAIA